MAAKKAETGNNGGTSKAESIRRTIRRLGGDAAPKEVIAILKKRKIEVSPAQVSNVKAHMKKEGLLGPVQTARGKISADDLFEAKKLADRLGGIKPAIRVLEALSRLR